MTLCFLCIWHLIRLFLGGIFSTELCCSEKPAWENTLLTDPSREDSLLYFSLTTFIPYFKGLKGRAIFIKITFFFHNISFSFRQVIAACLPWAGKELCIGRDPPPPDSPKHPAQLEGDQQCQGHHGTMPAWHCFWQPMLREGAPALVPALFVACEQASAGSSDDAPLTVMS